MKLIEYRKIAAAVEADLTAALAKHGLKPRPFGARIDERLGIVVLKLECADLNHKAADGSVTTPEAEMYKANCVYVELKPEWLGQSFIMGNKEFKIVGMKRRGEKCILIENGGKTFVATPEQVRTYMTVRDAKANSPAMAETARAAGRR